MAGEWAKKFIEAEGATVENTHSDDLDDLSTSFLESLGEIKQEFETLKQSNETLFVALQNLLTEVQRQNTEAIISANSQFMHLVVRKLDELEDRLSTDEPSYTNVLYSDPELFNEISERPEEEPQPQEPTTIHSKGAILENPPSINDEVVSPLEDHVIEGYNKWQAKEIKWSDFVKIAGGVKAAGKAKRILSESLSS